MGFADYIKTGLLKWPNWLTLFLWRCNFLGKYAYGFSYVKALKSSETFDRNEKLLEIVNYSIKNVPYYRKRYNGLVVRSIKEFEEKISCIDKDEVMSHWDEFLVDGIDMSKCVVGTTGGTSGKSLKLVIPKNRYIHSYLFWHKELKWYGWNYDSRAVLRNHKLSDNKVFMVNPVLKEFIFDAFRMSPNYAVEVYNVMKQYNIKYIHAYPSSAYQFLKYCYNQKRDLSFIKLCILTSETLTEEQKFFIEKTLGISIYISYGHSEKLIMAGTCPKSDYYHIEDNYGYFELLDKNNEVISAPDVLGEITGTTFINKYMPLIRYKTGDFTSYAKENSCNHGGHSYRLLNPVNGRWQSSYIFKADGSTTTTAALNLHSDILECIDGLQYIQENKGELIVLIIKNDLYTDNIECRLRKHYKDCLGEDSKIELRYVDHLIYQPNGKFLSYINRNK